VGDGRPVRLCWAAWVANAWDVSVAAINKGLISRVGAGGSRYEIASQDVRRRMIASRQRYEAVRFMWDPLYYSRKY
jgi:hypothetical protein